jgi:hypothetical protein
LATRHLQKENLAGKILLKQVLHRRPPAAPILDITHPKNQKEKSFKVFANVGCISH